MNDWPPCYKIRRSRRAKHISLSLTASKGLEIVLPMNASKEQGLLFLNDRRQWIEKHLPTLQNNQNEKMVLPNEISLAAIRQIWPVRYHYVQCSKKVIQRAINGRLIFTGPMKKFDDCLPAFNRWLRSVAQRYLPDYLLQVSEEIKLPFNRVSIRSQKTLWGSCNRQKDISLNDRLLFLPYELMRYVMIHELCHTVYFSHGKRFWQLVDRFDQNYKYNERSLRDVSKYIPTYLHHC